MKVRHSLMPLLILIFVVSAGAAALNSTRTTVVPLPSIPSRYSGPQDVESAEVTVLQSDAQVVRLSFVPPVIRFQEDEVEGNLYSAIRMNGEGVEEIPGAPEVPRIVRLVMVSNRGNFDAVVVDSHYVTGNLPNLPSPHVPLQEGERVLDGASELFLPEYYERDDWYPQEIVHISDPATFRDVRFVVLTVYPVQVNPLTGEVRTFDRVDVAILNAGGTGANEITHTPTSISPAFKELYRTFPNFEGSYLDELPVMPGKHLYICDPNATVVSSVTNLVNWRRKRGIDAYIATTTQTGTTATSIRNYIVNEYNSSNGTLEAVTLVGDPNATAPYQIATGTALDNTFATMSGGNPDPVPDLSVGRIPATSSGDLGIMISSIIDYEANPYMAQTGWYERTWCAAHTSQVPSNPSTKQYMRQIMLQHGVPTVHFDVFSGAMSTPILESRLNAGVTLFNDRLSWIGEFSDTQLSGVNVGDQLPYVWVVTCATGSFSQGSSLNEAFVRSDKAIGCVGMSGAGTHTRFNNILDGGGMQTIFAYDIRETGMAVVGAKLELYRNYNAVFPSDVSNFAAWCNLQGDPGVPIYLSVPRSLSVSHPINVTRGTNNVSVTVTSGGNPVVDALVGLTKGTETFSRGYTDANGQINLPVSLPTTGTLDIVVSGKDLKAFVGTISVINVAASLSYSSISIDDDNVGGTVGDNNDILNPGEIVDLSIVLQNTGTSQTVTGITGTLVSASPGVSVVNGVQPYPNLNVGATSGPTTPFRVNVGAVFDGEPVTFFLSTTSSAGSQTVRVDLVPSAASVAYVSSVFSDGNSQFDPGDSGNLIVTMQNDGSRSFVAANSILRSLNSYVSVFDSVGSFGNVNPGGTSTNVVNPFGISALAATPGGYQASMQLVVADGNGVVDSTNFLLPVGTSSATSPTGPDSYGYLAYENSDTQPAGANPQFEWIEIAPSLGGSGQSLGFTDGGEDQDDITVRALPFTFQFYGQQYDTITICSNGWISFGSSNQIDYRNFHMGSPLGPPSMVAAYWDDLIVTGVANGGVYVQNDATNGRFIIEWITRCTWVAANQTFQIILYDPLAYPSPTGDGKILVQYLDVNPSPNSISFDNDWATVGIQNHNHTAGLEITYWNVATPGSTPLADGRAIMFTTDLTGAIDPRFALLSPNGGEMWLQDSSVTVVWSPGSVIGNVNIELSRGGLGGPWSPIALNTLNDGQHTYVVTGPSSSTCRIRVTSVNTPDSSATSAGDFTIASIVVVLHEAFDTGAPGWIHSSPAGWLDQWHISTERSLSGANSYKCGDTGTGTYSNLLDAQLTSPLITNLPANAVLEFWHQIEGELSNQYPDSAYDGGWLEISADGGPFATIQPNEGYPKTTRYTAGSGNPYSGPVAGQDCYSGTIDAWTREQFDLSAYAESDIRLRWRFASDAGTTREGWYLDDVSIYGIGSASGQFVPAGLTIAISGQDVVLRWADDENTAYRIFSSNTPTQPFMTLEGETTDTSFTIPGGATAPQMFYYVVGWSGQ